MTALVQQTAVTPAPATPLQYLAGFVLLSILFSLTAYAAAYYALGATTGKNAVAVGVPLAATMLLLGRYPTAVMLVAAIAVDVPTFKYVYKLSNRRAALVTAAHFALTVGLSLALVNLLAVLGTAPT